MSPPGLNRELLGTERLQPHHREPASDDEGREHRGHDTDGQCDGEAFHRSRTEKVKNNGRDQGCDVRIENRRKGALIAGLNGCQGRAPIALFFADRRDRAESRRAGEKAK